MLEKLRKMYHDSAADENVNWNDPSEYCTRIWYYSLFIVSDDRRGGGYDDR